MELSLQGLRERARFLKSWKENLNSKPRGNFLVKLLDDKDGTNKARGDVLIRQEKTTNAIFQVVGRPDFSPPDFETIYMYHPSMFALIPSAGFVVKIEEHIEGALREKDIEKVTGTGDWATTWASNYKYKQMTIAKQKIEQGFLEEILKVLQETKMIITWANLHNQYEIDGKTGCTLKTVGSKEQRKKALDLVFTLSLGFDGTVTEELLVKKEKIIEEILYLQYEAIILRTLTKLPNASSLHLYPLVAMTGILEKINMMALSKVLEKWTSFGPKLDINFYYLSPEGAMPDNEGWAQFCKVADTYFTLEIEANKEDAESDSDDDDDGNASN